jgi:hypothetical protein
VPNKYVWAFGAFAMLLILNFTDVLGWFGNRLVQPLSLGNDDMPYARRIAESVLDSPSCAPFKNAILEAGKGPPASGATKYKIISAYEEAKRNGCRKAAP